MPRVNYASTHKHEFGASIDSWLHRIAIVFLPISTLSSALLFVFQRRVFLFEHAILSMHSLSFMGLLFAGIGRMLLIPGRGRILYYTTKISRVFLFWAAFILTRPLGATVGDFLDKPHAKGGLDLSRPIASTVLAVLIVVLILILPQRPGRHPRGAEART